MMQLGSITSTYGSLCMSAGKTAIKYTYAGWGDGTGDSANILVNGKKADIRKCYSLS